MGFVITRFSFEDRPPIRHFQSKEAQKNIRLSISDVLCWQVRESVKIPLDLIGRLKDLFVASNVEVYNCLNH